MPRIPSILSQSLKHLFYIPGISLHWPQTQMFNLKWGLHSQSSGELCIANHHAPSDLCQAPRCPRHDTVFLVCLEWSVVDEIPKGDHSKRYLPKGVMKVVEGSLSGYWGRLSLAAHCGASPISVFGVTAAAVSNKVNQPSIQSVSRCRLVSDLKYFP